MPNCLLTWTAKEPLSLLPYCSEQQEQIDYWKSGCFNFKLYSHICTYTHTVRECTYSVFLPPFLPVWRGENWDEQSLEILGEKPFFSWRECLLLSVSTETFFSWDFEVWGNSNAWPLFQRHHLGVTTSQQTFKGATGSILLTSPWTKYVCVCMCVCVSPPQLQYWPSYPLSK